MRDRFKFRVWKGLENRMVDNVTHLNPLLLDESLSEEAKYNVLMQCTGLKDKNEKLIYEGDIVKIFNTKDNFEQIRPVVFKDCAFQFNLPNSMQIDKPLYCWSINYLNHYKHIDLKIIGNIYENPELLEVKND